MNNFKFRSINRGFFLSLAAIFTLMGCNPQQAAPVAASGDEYVYNYDATPDYTGDQTYTDYSCSDYSCERIVHYAVISEGDKESDITLLATKDVNNTWKISAKSNESSTRDLEIFKIEGPSSILVSNNSDTISGTLKTVGLHYTPSASSSSQISNVKMLVRDMSRCKFIAEQNDLDLNICFDQTNQNLGEYDNIQEFNFSLQLSDADVQRCYRAYELENRNDNILQQLASSFNPTIGKLLELKNALTQNNVDCTKYLD